ncbi:MAG: hypothetical protein IPG46_20385 [Actinobacteria bacterium]|nr:hypothetical protein [Actinomycetota bacterium]
MRRSRASIALPDALLTTTELQLRHQISDLQANYEAERARLNGKLDAERARATDIRHQLSCTGRAKISSTPSLLFSGSPASTLSTWTSPSATRSTQTSAVRLNTHADSSK